ncbi:hypothetical protein GDO86_001623 [Hymenochirus boettgeri]|uniref:Ig-like domain-containing protein n=1 Tax=Hymenochirus boettgeri TaxID=247094 RepID=A0A8T2KGM3_9PIPI|nr:hypothetical protein GDO86_001623 [Hymenochirus boettgeri]
MLYIFLKRTLGQFSYSVNQSKSLTVSEGDPAQMNCSYTGTENSLQWYRQIRGQPPQILLIHVISGYKTDKGFSMFLDTKSKFTFLYLNVTQVEDSAVYYCALLLDYWIREALYGSIGWRNVNAHFAAAARIPEEVVSK